jgi:hypothetical protein
MNLMMKTKRIVIVCGVVSGASTAMRSLLPET